MEGFKAVLAKYYKAERDRSEECMGDIIKILEAETSEVDQIEMILSRLTRHYGR